MDNYFFRERTEKLCDMLVPHLFQGFFELFKRAKTLHSQINRDPRHLLMTFQLCLKRIPDLPMYRLVEDYKILQDNLLNNGMPSDWLDKIVAEIYMSYAKSHLINNGASEHIKIRKVDLEIPDNVQFIHQCYIECARCFWQEPYLFSEKCSSIEVQRNQVLAQQKIRDCIYKTIRNRVPLDSLLNIYNGNGEFSDSEYHTKYDKTLHEPSIIRNKTQMESLLEEELAHSHDDVVQEEIEQISLKPEGQFDAYPHSSNPSLTNKISKELEDKMDKKEETKKAVSDDDRALIDDIIELEHTIRSYNSESQVGGSTNTANAKKTISTRSTPSEQSSSIVSTTRPSNNKNITESVPTVTTNSKTDRLCLDNLNKLQAELVRDTLRTRTGTMSTSSKLHQHPQKHTSEIQSTSPSTTSKHTSKHTSTLSKHTTNKTDIKTLIKDANRKLQATRSNSEQSGGTETHYGTDTHSRTTIEIPIRNSPHIPRESKSTGYADVSNITKLSTKTHEQSEQSEQYKPDHESSSNESTTSSEVENSTMRGDTNTYDRDSDFNTVLTSAYDDRRSLIRRNILKPEYFFTQSYSKSHLDPSDITTLYSGYQTAMTEPIGYMTKSPTANTEKQFEQRTNLETDL